MFHIIPLDDVLDRFLHVIRCGGAGIEPYLQPKVSIHQNGRHEISGYEALMRWRDKPEGVRIDTLILGASMNGLHEELFDVMTDRVCSALAKHIGQINIGRPPPIAINIVAQQLVSSRLLESLLRITETYGLLHTDLTIELTEHVEAGDPEQTRNYLQDVRDAGFRVAIDDFGVGFSTLSYMHRFPVDEVKLDRSFLNGPDVKVARMLFAVTELCHQLDCKVTLEGVETEAQHWLAVRSGIDCGQGWLYGRPEPIDNALSKRTITEQVTAPGCPGGSGCICLAPVPQLVFG